MIGRRVFLFLSSAFMLPAAPAQAAPRPGYGRPPAWVDVAPVPEPPPPENAAAVQTLLDDNQTFFSPDGDAFYNRRIWRILRPEGLAGFKTLGLTWSPETEVVTFHAIRILRDGKAIDLLQNGRGMLVLRRETNLERAMLDGRMTASRQIEGLQVGDLLEFSWTQSRRDPIYGGRSYDYEALSFPGVAGRYRARLSWPDDAPVQWRATEGLAPPTVIARDRRTWLTVDMPLARAPKGPAGAPARYHQLGGLEATSFRSWAEVSALMAPLYARSMALDPDSPLKVEAAAIAARTADPAARAFAALQLVEDKTRYLFLGMGDGGYVPARADDTWVRRFGDCKAKTVLLLAVLRELGVPAEPALVNLGGGDGLDARLPSLGAFNHVLVRAVIAGKVYWLDGTRSGDRSGLAALRPPPHRWALPLRPRGAELERIDQPALDVPQVETVMRLDASRGLDLRAPVKMMVRLAGDGAVRLRLSLTSAPKDDVERALRQQLSASANWIETETLSWRDNPEHDAFEINVTGSADMDWRRNLDLNVREYKVVAAQTQPGGFPRREPGPNREAPYGVNHPLYVRTLVEVVLPDKGKGYSVRGPSSVETFGGYELRRSSSLDAGLARFSTDLRSLAAEIPYAEAEAANKTLRRLAAEESLIRAPA